MATRISIITQEGERFNEECDNLEIADGSTTVELLSVGAMKKYVKLYEERTGETPSVEHNSGSFIVPLLEQDGVTRVRVYSSLY